MTMKTHAGRWGGGARRSDGCTQNGQRANEALDSCPFEDCPEAAPPSAVTLSAWALQISKRPSPLAYARAWDNVGAVAKNTASTTAHHSAQGRRSASNGCVRGMGYGPLMWALVHAVHRR
jgi:hypothetical protein